MVRSDLVRGVSGDIGTGSSEYEPCERGVVDPSSLRINFLSPFRSIVVCFANGRYYPPY